MKRADHRSVGELLLECDLTARRMLIDPDVLDPAAMVRAWPEVVQAAHELLQALPTKDSPTATIHGPQGCARATSPENGCTSWRSRCT